MRIADRGLRNRNAADSYETEEESSISSKWGGVQFRIPHFSFPRMHFRCDLESQPIQGNESGRIRLVISLRRVSLHGGDLWIVQAHRTHPPGSNHVAFVQFHAHEAGDMLLRLRDHCRDRVPLPRKPETVREQPRLLSAQ